MPTLACVFVTQIVQVKVICPKFIRQNYSNCPIKNYHQHWNVSLLLKLSNQKSHIQNLLDKLLKFPVKHYQQHGNFLVLKLFNQKWFVQNLLDKSIHIVQLKIISNIENVSLLLNLSNQKWVVQNLLDKSIQIVQLKIISNIGNVSLLLNLSNQKWVVQNLLGKAIQIVWLNIITNIGMCLCYSNCPIKGDLFKAYWTNY